MILWENEVCGKLNMIKCLPFRTTLSALVMGQSMLCPNEISVTSNEGKEATGDSESS